MKYQVVIPDHVMQQIGWSHGDDLEARINAKGLLVIKRQLEQPIEEPDYEQFKHAVTKALTALPNGCVWSELRLKAGLCQMTPSPIWVKRMEDEGCLERIRDSVTARLVWRLPKQVPIGGATTLNGWTKD
jgi:hypothetical protein